MMARVGSLVDSLRMFANDACERMISHSNDQSIGDEGLEKARDSHRWYAISRYCISCELVNVESMLRKINSLYTAERC